MVMQKLSQFDILGFYIFRFYILHFSVLYFPIIPLTNEFRHFKSNNLNNRGNSAAHRSLLLEQTQLSQPKGAPQPELPKQLL